MIKSKKVISIYEPNDIYKVIEELNKGARELGKLTLEEQTKRAERLIAGWRNRQTHSVVGGHNLKVRLLPLQPTYKPKVVFISWITFTGFFARVTLRPIIP